MTENWRILNSLVRSGCVDLNDFYVIRVDKYDMKLQGHASKKKRFKYKSMFSLKKSTRTIEQFEGQKGDIKMVLTRKDY